GITQQVRAVGSEDAAAVARIAVVEPQDGCQRLSGLQRGDAAQLEMPPRVDIRGDETIRNVEAGNSSLSPKVAAVLREILVGTGSQERRRIVNGFGSRVGNQQGEVARQAPVERELQRLETGIRAAFDVEDSCESRIRAARGNSARPWRGLIQ